MRRFLRGLIAWGAIVALATYFPAIPIILGAIVAVGCLLVASDQLTR